MGFIVGQKIMLWRVLSLLRQDSEGPQVDTANAALSASAKEISKLEGEFQVPQSTQENKASETATYLLLPLHLVLLLMPLLVLNLPYLLRLLPAPILQWKVSLVASDSVFSPDSKQLKLLQLSCSPFILANIKILESLFTKSPCETVDYLTYLKFLAIKGTRFQTKAILAFDQDYCATKAQDNFRCGTNLDDVSAQYLDSAMAQCPPRNESRGDSCWSGNEEFCFCWIFNPTGCPNPQSCRYKHVCIHCSSTQHKGKSCLGSANAEKSKE